MVVVILGSMGLGQFVRRLIQDNPKMPVIIQADEAVSTGMTVRVIDEAKLAGAQAVNISTEN